MNKQGIELPPQNEDEKQTLQTQLEGNPHRDDVDYVLANIDGQLLHGQDSTDLIRRVEDTMNSLRDEMEPGQARKWTLKNIETELEARRGESATNTPEETQEKFLAPRADPAKAVEDLHAAMQDRRQETPSSKSSELSVSQEVDEKETARQEAQRRTVQSRINEQGSTENTDESTQESYSRNPDEQAKGSSEEAPNQENENDTAPKEDTSEKAVSEHPVKIANMVEKKVSLKKTEQLQGDFAKGKVSAEEIKEHLEIKIATIKGKEVRTEQEEKELQTLENALGYNKLRSLDTGAFLQSKKSFREWDYEEVRGYEEAVNQIKKEIAGRREKALDSSDPELHAEHRNLRAFEKKLLSHEKDSDLLEQALRKYAFRTKNIEKIDLARQNISFPEHPIKRIKLETKRGWNKSMQTYEALKAWEANSLMNENNWLKRGLKKMPRMAVQGLSFLGLGIVATAFSVLLAQIGGVWKVSKKLFQIADSEAMGGIGILPDKKK